MRRNRRHEFDAVEFQTTGAIVTTIRGKRTMLLRVCGPEGRYIVFTLRIGSASQPPPSKSRRIRLLEEARGLTDASLEDFIHFLQDGLPRVDDPQFAALRLFAADMERRLRENDRSLEWDGQTDNYLMSCLEENVEQLLSELRKSQRDPKRIVHEAADIANLAMMLAHRWRESEISE